jgi:hypothetical protein
VVGEAVADDPGADHDDGLARGAHVWRAAFEGARRRGTVGN